VRRARRVPRASDAGTLRHDEDGHGRPDESAHADHHHGGSNRGGPCYQLQREAEKVLAGKIKNERLFAVIYTIDAGDDWTSELALLMANPNCGVSVELGYLRQQQTEARQSARKQNTFKTKHLNIWVNSAGRLDEHA
jgi:phage terminase large subunit-like protein